MDELPPFAALVKRVNPSAVWADLVLPAPAIATLRQIADEVRLRSHGFEDWGLGDPADRGPAITVLFVGGSGAAKAMAAEALANELSLPLYRVDLTTVISKYIAETEKNLARLFDAAERGQPMILFLDEADALFGRRSEAKDCEESDAAIDTCLRMRSEAPGDVVVVATKTAPQGSYESLFRFVVPLPNPES